ncbi:MAG: hypothetical protein CL912_25575 [Deltaproteobacteria bacterium]|nr:hypothetical protein [Deltaproteobacteria bacterium]
MKEVDLTFPQKSRKNSGIRRKIKNSLVQTQAERQMLEESGLPIVDESFIMEFTKRIPQQVQLQHTMRRSDN